MTTKTSRALWLAFLLGVVLAASWLGRAGAQEPPFILNDALRLRLAGQVQGPWVGQAASRAYVLPGETLEYLLYYGNNGPAIAQATLVDYLPVWCGQVSVDRPDARYDALNHRLEIDLGELAGGALGIVHIVSVLAADAPAAAGLVNVAELWGPAGLADESSSAPPIVVQAPRIEVALSGPAAFRHNEDADYTLTYTNRGNLGTGRLALNYQLPEGFYPLSYVDTPSWAAPNLVLSDALGLAPDEWRTQVVRVHVLPISRAQPRLPVTCTTWVSSVLPTGVTVAGEGSSSGLIATSLVFLQPVHGGALPAPTPTPPPETVTLCGSTEDLVYRIDGSLFQAYASDSASSSPLRRVISPPAPAGWNQPDYAPDSAWRRASPVWSALWAGPSWAPQVGGCAPIGLPGQNGQPEGVDGVTLLYRRTFTLAPRTPGMVITSAVLRMWSDNKSEWWWQGRSVAYDRETNIGEVELFPRDVAAEGGSYLLAVQDSNDTIHAFNPQGITYQLSVTWSYGGGR